MSPSKMNSAGFSETYTDDHPVPQHTADSRSSSSYQTRQGQKKISISPAPILRHLGLARAQSSSSNPDHIAPEAPVPSVSNLKTNKEISYGCGESQLATSRREDSIYHVSGTNMKQPTATGAKSQSLTGGTSQDQCSAVANTQDEYSSPFSFGKCKPSQAKRSKFKHANAYSPLEITKKDFTSDTADCNQIHEHNNLITGQLQQHTHTTDSNGSPKNCPSDMSGYIYDQSDASLPTSFGKKSSSCFTKSKPKPANLKDHVTSSKEKPNHFQNPSPLFPFDIFQSEHEFPNSTDVIFAKDDEQRSKSYQLGDGFRDRSRVLRPGMVLLKGYLTQHEQVSVARECRNLGLGPGGFYKPGYKYGAKLRLMMMCLGRDWDPQTRKYSNRRQLDNSQPPDIPHQFLGMVNGAMVTSQALVEREDEENNVADILPMIIPDICIVNFYTTTGRLGLHQDRDESAESLEKGVPVVSMSVGDSAEFLYGDDRDISKADKLVLESGDVLIFGGQSRHIFHGVGSIIPGSAPESLLRETHLLPGRLNLTFRQF